MDNYLHKKVAVLTVRHLDSKPTSTLAVFPHSVPEGLHSAVTVHIDSPSHSSRLFYNDYNEQIWTVDNTVLCYLIFRILLCCIHSPSPCIHVGSVYHYLTPNNLNSTLTSKSCLALWTYQGFWVSTCLFIFSVLWSMAAVTVPLHSWRETKF